MKPSDESNYRKIIKAIAAHFGKNCEVVLHDYSKPYDSTIIAIENGHVSGRKVGDCGTNLGLEILRGTNNNSDQYNYITHLKNNHLLRSSSVYLKDEDNNAVGAICINFDVTDVIIVKNLLEDISFQNSSGFTENKPEEFITNNITSLLDAMIDKSVSNIGIPVSRMSKDNKVEAIKFLENRGAFLVKKSAEYVAKYFGISKFTLYNYLNTVNSKTEPD